MDVLAEIADERARQDKQWGGATHDDGHRLATWVGLLDERVRKITEALGMDPRSSHQVDARRARRETVVLAALAVAFVEALDRRAWSPGNFEESSDDVEVDGGER